MRASTQLEDASRPHSGGLALGAKTIELIHQNVHAEAVRDDLETLIVDAELLEAIMGSPDPKKRAQEFEGKLTARLRKHMGNPKFRALSERLEALKERHEQGLLNSVEFLKNLLAIARDLVATEKETAARAEEEMSANARVMRARIDECAAYERPGVPPIDTAGNAQSSAWPASWTAPSLSSSVGRSFPRSGLIALDLLTASAGTPVLGWLSACRKSVS